MKDAKQLGEDFKNNEEIRKGFLVEMNKLRNDENLDAKAAGIMVAKRMGYEVTDEEEYGWKPSTWPSRQRKS